MTVREIMLVAWRFDEVLWARQKVQDRKPCDVCGDAVNIYPAGAGVLRDYPDAMIVCTECIEGCRPECWKNGILCVDDDTEFGE